MRYRELAYGQYRIRTAPRAWAIYHVSGSRWTRLETGTTAEQPVTYRGLLQMCDLHARGTSGSLYRALCDALLASVQSQPMVPTAVLRVVKSDAQQAEPKPSKRARKPRTEDTYESEVTAAVSQLDTTPDTTVSSIMAAAEAAASASQPSKRARKPRANPAKQPIGAPKSAPTAPQPIAAAAAAAEPNNAAEHRALALEATRLAIALLTAAAR